MQESERTDDESRMQDALKEGRHKIKEYFYGLSDPEEQQVAAELLALDAVLRLRVFLDDRDDYSSGLRKVTEEALADDDGKIRPTSVVSSVFRSLSDIVHYIVDYTYDPQKHPRPFFTPEDIINFSRKIIINKIFKRRRYKLSWGGDSVVALVEDNCADDNSYVVDLQDINVPNKVDRLNGSGENTIWARRFFIKTLIPGQSAEEIAREYTNLGCGRVDSELVEKICRQFLVGVLDKVFDQTFSYPLPEERDVFNQLYIEQKKREELDVDDKVIDYMLQQLEEITTNLSISLVDNDTTYTTD